MGRMLNTISKANNPQRNEEKTFPKEREKEKQKNQPTEQRNMGKQNDSKDVSA